MELVQRDSTSVLRKGWRTTTRGPENTWRSDAIPWEREREREREEREIRNKSEWLNCLHSLPGWDVALFHRLSFIFRLSINKNRGVKHVVSWNVFMVVKYTPTYETLTWRCFSWHSLHLTPHIYSAHTHTHTTHATRNVLGMMTCSVITKCT
jgi:hypothetical protein